MRASFRQRCTTLALAIQARTPHRLGSRPGSDAWQDERASTSGIPATCLCRPCEVCCRRRSRPCRPRSNRNDFVGAPGLDVAARHSDESGCVDADRTRSWTGGIRTSRQETFRRPVLSFDQAVAVTSSQDVDLDAVRRWSTAEGRDEHCQEFLRALPRPS